MVFNHISPKSFTDLFDLLLPFIIFDREEVMYVLNSLWKSYGFVEFRVVRLEIEFLRFGMGFSDWFG